MADNICPKKKVLLTMIECHYCIGGQLWLLNDNTSQIHILHYTCTQHHRLHIQHQFTQHTCHCTHTCHHTTHVTAHKQHTQHTHVTIHTHTHTYVDYQNSLDIVYTKSVNNTNLSCENKGFKMYQVKKEKTQKRYNQAPSHQDPCTTRDQGIRTR